MLAVLSDAYRRQHGVPQVRRRQGQLLATPLVVVEAVHPNHGTPSPSSYSVRCKPMKPAHPVTSARIGVSSPSGADPGSLAGEYPLA